MPKLTLPKGTYSVKQVADHFAVSVTAIHAKIKKKKLPATKVGSQWVIETEADMPVYFRNY